MAMRNTMLVAGGVMSLVAWGMALAEGAQAVRPDASAALATVVVQAAGPVVGDRTSFDGVVEAVRQTTLSAQVPGAIVALHVKAGDRVKAGQEIVLGVAEKALADPAIGCKMG